MYGNLVRLFPIILAVAFSSVLMIGTSVAEEFVPLDPRLRSELNSRAINYENLQLTEDEQADLLLWLGIGYQPRSAIEAHIRDIQRERIRANGSGRTLRQIVGDDDEGVELSASEERRIRTALRKPGIPEIDFESLTLEEKRRLLVVISTSATSYDVLRLVNSLLANR